MPPSTSESSNTTPRVMIVDDDRDIRENLGELLRDEGFAVEAAWNGAEAMKRLDAGYRPEVIILDLMMPVMDGVTFRARLKATKNLASIPVIGLTAFPTIPVDFLCLTKPLSFDSLITQIQSALA